ncbi:bifunctional oligoribonuclease/PAP phosphatase NrnA [Candidatus Woesebacteria bacterium]|nr:bifunctional oligoribonuclease/PAP phosphatase NrnA [Candidatus Woesebacteria bacterium]
MNYPLSKKILEEIKKANKILVNCHRSPDADSAGSALALYEVLASFAKDVKVICPDKLPEDLKFLPFSEKVEKIDFEKFDFTPYDLFIVLDSRNAAMVTKKRDMPLPKNKKIVIDHHKTNESFAEINLVDDEISSTAELLYDIFEDWGTGVTKSVAQNLLTGIIADTGVFAYSKVSARTLQIALFLMEKGADKNEIILNIFRSYPFNKVKFWGEILKRMEWDEEHHFVWSAVPYEVYKNFDNPASAKASAASLFAPVIKGTNFGMIMVEEEKGILSISLRGRTDFDVSKIAEKLGGGGHLSAAGAKLYEKDFDAAVLKVLETARKIVNEN